jgi:chemotaxis protein MotB
MKKVLFILLPILLILAVVAFLFTYVRYMDREKALLVSENELSHMRETLSELEQKNSALHEQVQQGLKQKEALASARKELLEQRDNMAVLSEEIKVSHDTIHRMRIEIQESKSTLNQIEEKMEEKEYELEKYRGDLFLLKTQQEEDRAYAEQVRTKHDDIASKLKREIENRDQIIADLHEDLTAEKGRIKEVHRALEKAYRDIEELNKKVHDRDLRIAEIGENLTKTESEMATVREALKDSRMRRGDLEKRIQDLFGEKVLLKGQMNQLQSTYESMVSELNDEIRKKEVTIEELEDKLSITFVDHILFDFAEANMSPAGEQILTRIGTILKDVKNKEIRVVGHTDNVPIAKGYQSKFPSNWELSAARAAAVVRYLQIEIGLDPENLEAVGRSYYDPRADNETDEGRSRNRRVNIIIAPKIE